MVPDWNVSVLGLSGAPIASPTLTNLSRCVEPAWLRQHLRHHVLDSGVPREHSRTTPSGHKPPRLRTTPPGDGDASQGVSPRPAAQPTPSTSLRSDCAVPCGRRPHFDLAPLPTGGWNVCSIGVCSCHPPRLTAESFPLIGWERMFVRRLRRGYDRREVTSGRLEVLERLAMVTAG